MTENVPDLAWELALDESQVVPAVVQAAGKLRIHVLSGCRLGADQRCGGKVAHNLTQSASFRFCVSPGWTDHAVQPADQGVQDLYAIPGDGADQQGVELGRVQLVGDDAGNVDTLARTELGLRR